MRTLISVFLMALAASGHAQMSLPAEPGNAIQFNGSSGFASANVLPPTGSITVMGWFSPNVLNNPSSSFGNQGLFGYRTSFNFYILMLPNGRVEYRAGFGNVSANIVSLEAACVGGWAHAAMVYNQAEGTVTAYFNGLEVNTVSTGNSDLPQVNDPFRIARQQFAAQNYWFSGRVDNVAMINRALTQDELLDFIAHDIDEGEEDLVVYYKMDQSEGTSILGSPGVNLALNGGYAWVESDFAVAIPEGSADFVESPDDDGSVATSDPFQLVLHNATFNAEIGEDLIATGKAEITNLPEGLEATLVVVNSTTATLEVGGAALSNGIADSIDTTDLRLISGALNEHCGWLGYPLSFSFIECAQADVEILASDVAVCPGETVTLTASGAESYTWSDGTVGDTLEFTVNESTVLSVIAPSDPGCAPNEASITIEVFDVSPVSIGESESVAICPGNSVVLTATDGFQSYLWSDGSFGPELVVDSPGSYSATATDANGCESVSDTVEVALYSVDTPEVTWNGELLLCEGASLTLQAEEGFSTYLWNTGVESSAITVDQAGLYSVTVTDANNCTTSSETIEVSVSELGSAVFVGDSEVDEGSEVTYSIEGDDFEIDWEVEGGTIVSEDNQGMVVLWGSPGTGSVSYTLTNADGCVFGPFNAAITINLIIGIPESIRPLMEVYPNPASELITFDSVGLLPGLPCHIVDANGRLIDTFVSTAVPFTVPVHHLPRGVYSIVPEDRSWTVRFVKE